MTQPFAHEDLEIKQNFLKLAQEFHQKASNLENELSAALLYMNVADYLAEYLVTGLNDLVKEAVGKYYLGVISVKPHKRQGLNIGESLRQLKTYEFPQKTAIIEELTEINKARNQIAHQILKTKGQDLPKIDDAATSLADHTEKLVVLVDEISLGLPPQTMVDKFLTAEQKQESNFPGVDGTETPEKVKPKPRK